MAEDMSQDQPDGQTPAQPDAKTARKKGRSGVLGLFLRPATLAILICLAVVAWMASGAVRGSDAPKKTTEKTAGEKAGKKAPLFTVGVALSTAKKMTRSIVAQGALEPARTVKIQAEIAGKVDKKLVKKGAVVAAGQAIVQLATDDRQALLDKAKAQFAQADRDYKAAFKLGRSGYTTESRLATLKAQLEVARAAVGSAELAIKRLTIRAPYGGVLNSLPVELGKFVRVGDAVAEVVEVNPMIAVVNIAQQDIAKIKVGNIAGMRTLGGIKTTGKITFVSAQADAQTRTFRVEIQVKNPNRTLRAGTSVEVGLPVQTLQAHFISPQYLSLGTDSKTGKRMLGVKAVGPGDIVQFYAVSIIEARNDGAWVSGLPDQLKLIIRGSGFVQTGQKVAVSIIAKKAPADAVKKTVTE